MKNYAGTKVGMLTAVERADTVGFWLFTCDCGEKAVARIADFNRGRHKSCGCLKTRSGSKAYAFKHGKIYSAEYTTWQNMVDRCCNPNNPKYVAYGGRGIAVCDRWRDSFLCFFTDMKEKPSPRHSLDRINNYGDYEPGNCRWATPSEQARNKRTSIYLVMDGERTHVLDAAKKKGIKKGTVYRRIKLGWSIEAAVMTPVVKCQR